MRETQATQVATEAEMPKRNVWMTVDMHPLSTLASALAFWQSQIPLKAENRSAGCRFPNKGFKYRQGEKRTRRRASGGRRRDPQL